VTLSIVVVALLIRFSTLDSEKFKEWHPEPIPPWDGPLKQNAELIQARQGCKGQLNGPVKIVRDPKTGYFYTGTLTGEIKRIKDEKAETVAKIDGKPNGFTIYNGKLYVADAEKGKLLEVDPTNGSVKTLLTEVNGVPLLFVNDVEVSGDGTMLYVTDSSHINNYVKSELEFTQTGSNGRLFSYNLSTGKANLLLDQLYFANGLTLSHDESFLLISETSVARIRRYWLKGPKAGTDDIFMSNLPGIPDNISRARSKGHYYWIALIAPRIPLFDLCSPYPKLKVLLTYIPKSLQPVQLYGLVILVDEEGNILRSLHDPTGNTANSITSANQFGSELYLGNTRNDFFNIYTLETEEL